MRKKLYVIVLCAVLAAQSMFMGASINAYAGEIEEGNLESDKVGVIVSLGDSYSSGEGIEPFYGQDKPMEEKKEDEDWLAHRSELSWPGQLTLPGMEGTFSDYKDENWFFKASSGAKTENMSGTQTKEYNRDGYKGSKNLAGQLEIFKEINANGENVDYVTITIGGNDVDFANIIKKSVIFSYTIPKVVSKKIDNVWKKYDKETRNGIKNTYYDIAGLAGNDARIIVAGYPKLLNSKESNIIKSSSSQLINENVSKFNNELAQLVSECNEEGLNIFFAPVEEYFDGHEAYTEEAYLNPVILLPEGTEDLKEKSISSAYSIHPNAAGAEKYAEAVQKIIDDLEKNGGVLTPSDLEDDWGISTEIQDKYLSEEEKSFLERIFARTRELSGKIINSFMFGDEQTAVDSIKEIFEDD